MAPPMVPLAFPRWTDGESRAHPSRRRCSTPSASAVAGPWPDDPRFDPELLAAGDRRNVVDRYRYWPLEAIVADLDPAGTRSTSPSRTGSTTSTSAPSSARRTPSSPQVHIVGRRRWNRRGAMVTDRYQHVGTTPTSPHLVGVGTRRRSCRWSAVDNLPGAVPIERPTARRCVLLFGQEGRALAEARAAARRVCRSRSSARRGRSTPASAAGSPCIDG